jgi:hypothetical protein
VKSKLQPAETDGLLGNAFLAEVVVNLEWNYSFEP